LQLSPRIEEREHHDGLAETHVVGKTAAELKPAEERKPAKRIALVFAQRPAERSRRIFRDDAAKGVQFRPNLREGLVVGDRRLCSQQRIEQRRLRPAESNRISLGISEASDPRVTLEPLLRQQTDASVIEDDDVFAPGDGRQQLGKGSRSSVSKIDGSMQIEPVDPGRHFEPHTDGRTKCAAFRFDSPALTHERVNDLWKLFGRYTEQLTRLEVAPCISKAKLVETIDRRLFRGSISSNQSPIGSIVGSGGGRAFHNGTVVLELHRGAKILPQGIRILAFRARNAYARPRRSFNHVVAKVRRQRAGVETGTCNRLDQRRGLLPRNRDWTEAAQLGDPGKRSPDFKACETGLGEQEPSAQQQYGITQVQPIPVPHEAARYANRIGSVLGGNLKIESPRRTVVPHKSEE